MNLRDSECQNSIARIMVDASYILWSRHIDWFEEHEPNIDFDASVGSGKATYMQYSPGRIRIRYGIKMIDSKLDIQTASGWLTAKELSAHQLYGGRLEYRNLIAATVLHEFAHAIQRVGNFSPLNKSHDEGFYRCLLDLHKSEAASDIRQFIEATAAAAGITLKFCQGHLADFKTMDDFIVGESVCILMENGNIQVGIVQRKTRSFLIVRSKEKTWKCKPSALEKIRKKQLPSHEAFL